MLDQTHAAVGELRDRTFLWTQENGSHFIVSVAQMDVFIACYLKKVEEMLEQLRDATSQLVILKIYQNIKACVT